MPRASLRDEFNAFLPGREKFSIRSRRNLENIKYVYYNAQRERVAAICKRTSFNEISYSALTSLNLGTFLRNLNQESSLREFSIFNIRLFLRSGNICKRVDLIIHRSFLQPLIMDLQKAFIKRASGESESR